MKYDFPLQKLYLFAPLPPILIISIDFTSLPDMSIDFTSLDPNNIRIWSCSPLKPSLENYLKIHQLSFFIA